MIVIEIFAGDDQVQTRQAGERTFYFQQVYLHQPSQRFPLAVQLPLEQDDSPYPVGRYTLAPESLFVNQYQSLELSRFKQRLQPIEGAPDDGTDGTI